MPVSWELPAMRRFASMWPATHSYQVRANTESMTDMQRGSSHMAWQNNTTTHLGEKLPSRLLQSHSHISKQPRPDSWVTNYGCRADCPANLIGSICRVWGCMVSDCGRGGGAKWTLHALHGIWVHRRSLALYLTQQLSNTWQTCQVFALTNTASSTKILSMVFTMGEQTTEDRRGAPTVTKVAWT